MSMGINKEEDTTLKPLSFSDIKLKSFYESANETKLHPISVFNNGNVIKIQINLI